MTVCLYDLRSTSSQAHSVFTRLRWVAGFSFVLCSTLILQRLQPALHWKQLILPVLGIILSALAGAQSQKYKQLMEFNDYR